MYIYLFLSDYDIGLAARRGASMFTTTAMHTFFAEWFSTPSAWLGVSDRALFSSQMPCSQYPFAFLSSYLFVFFPSWLARHVGRPM